jgi:nicotinate-nucleotide adenylyltransferase
MSNIGILGGTFDPIHNGHIMLAKEAYEQFLLDKIWVMVSKNPPHKSGKKVSDSIKRSEMVKLAIKNYPYMEFSDFELKREGYIYTSDTLTLLKQIYPNDNFFFILGGDSLRDFKTWHNPEIVLEKCILLVATRDEIIDEEYKKSLNSILTEFSDYHPDIRRLITTPVNISSHEIRANISHIEQFEPYMNKDVMKYILDNNLYI